MRSIGQGYTSIQMFTTLMDLPTPISQKSCNSAIKAIAKVVQDVAEETMTDAVNNLKENSVGEIVDVGISGDGS